MNEPEKRPRYWREREKKQGDYQGQKKSVDNSKHHTRLVATGDGSTEFQKQSPAGTSVAVHQYETLQCQCPASRATIGANTAIDSPGTTTLLKPHLSRRSSRRSQISSSVPISKTGRSSDSSPGDPSMVALRIAARRVFATEVAITAICSSRASNRSPAASRTHPLQRSKRSKVAELAAPGREPVSGVSSRNCSHSPRRTSSTHGPSAGRGGTRLRRRCERTH